MKYEELSFNTIKIHVPQSNTEIENFLQWRRIPIIYNLFH